MSGGSMDYLYEKVSSAEFYTNTPLRRAFKKHLKDVAAALRAIEWNDSGDGDDREEDLIRALLAKDAEVNAAVEEAKRAHAELGKAIEKASGSASGGT